jgi:ATP-dependent Clp protease ATP-binding subunit ClpX
MDGISLSFSDEALDYIVDKAVEFKLGARGLRAICESIMIDAMFELPSTDEKEFVVTTSYATKKLERINMKMLKSA